MRYGCALLLFEFQSRWARILHRLDRNQEQNQGRTVANSRGLDGLGKAPISLLICMSVRSVFLRVNPRLSFVPAVSWIEKLSKHSCSIFAILGAHTPQQD